MDYGAAGVALTFAAWQWLRGEGRALPAALAALAGICAYNGNGWVLVALPLIRVLGKTKAELPRWLDLPRILRRAPGRTGHHFGGNGCFGERC